MREKQALGLAGSVNALMSLRGFGSNRRFGLIPALAAASIAILFATVAIVRSGAVLARQADDMRSFSSTLVGSFHRPSFRAGPFPPGHTISQQIDVSMPLVGLFLWLEPANRGDVAVGQIELRGGPLGPSLRSGQILLPAGDGEFLVVVRPALRPAELTDGRTAYLFLTAAPGSPPVRVGINEGDRYPLGGSFIGAQPNWPDQDVYFAAFVPFGLRDQIELAVSRLARLGPRVSSLIGMALLGVGILAMSQRRALIRFVAISVLLAVVVAMSLVFAMDAFGVRLLPGPGILAAGELL